MADIRAAAPLAHVYQLLAICMQIQEAGMFLWLRAMQESGTRDSIPSFATDCDLGQVT